LPPLGLYPDTQFALVIISLCSVHTLPPLAWLLSGGVLPSGPNGHLIPIPHHTHCLVWSKLLCCFHAFYIYIYIFFFHCLVTELHIQFAQFDKDADGVITTDELAQVMRSLGLKLKSDEIRRIVDRVDIESKSAKRYVLSLCFTFLRLVQYLMFYIFSSTKPIFIKECY